MHIYYTQREREGDRSFPCSFSEAPKGLLNKVELCLVVPNSYSILNCLPSCLWSSFVHIVMKRRHTTMLVIYIDVNPPRYYETYTYTLIV